jgi:hypothetical protein|tara:strand:+ start:63 stop:581 length:519 start_codon:yes stop_codon:yes gene_type:complete
MIHEDAPTNSVGTGAETALPPAHEPGVKKRKKKLSRVKSMLQVQFESYQTFPFLVQLPDIGEFIMSGKSPLEVKMKLRTMIQPPYAETKVKITRLFSGQVLNYYNKKRERTMSGFYEAVDDKAMQSDMAASQIAIEKKKVQLKKQQLQKQLQQKTMQLKQKAKVGGGKGAAD